MAAYFTPHRITIVLGLVPLLVGALVLIGWQTDSYILKRIIDSPIPVNPMTAVLFLLLGSAMVFSRPSLRAVAMIAGAAAALKCCDMFLGTAFRVDAWMFAAELPLEPAFPNSMAPATTLNFLFLALALLLPHRTARKICLLLPMIVSLNTLAAYALGDGSLRGIAWFTPMALITAITFLVASCGVWVGKKPPSK